MLKFTVLLVVLTSPAWGTPTTYIQSEKWVKIIGGQPAIIDTRPYIASVQLLDEHVCGGTIISSRWIVTAAHCFFGSNAQFIHTCTVRVGSSFHATGGEVINATALHVHGNYSTDTQDNDIALIQLAKAITISSASSIGLAVESPVAGTTATVSGWGEIYLGGPYSAYLRSIQISIIREKECREACGDGLTVTERMICAKDVTGEGRSFCRGDSGGPLVANGLLTGVVSKGGECFIDDSPGIYTSIASMREWIRETSGV